MVAWAITQESINSYVACRYGRYLRRKLRHQEPVRQVRAVRQRRRSRGPDQPVKSNHLQDAEEPRANRQPGRKPFEANPPGGLEHAAGHHY